MKIALAEALAQLKDELRQAVLDSKKDIVFVPKEVALELSIGFDLEAQAKGGFKLFAFLDTSVEASGKRRSDHKLTLKLDVADDQGQPLKVRDEAKRNF